ncbi:MAG: efflux RND transporter permease subunit, partial [bacterium]
LQQVEGISQAEVVGGVEREIIVEPDIRKMAIYGVSIEDIRQALSRSNISFPGGKIRQGPLHLSLRIVGEFESLSDIESTDVMRPGQSPVRVSDIARVIDSVKEIEGVTLLGGDTVVSLLLYKEPEANTIQVSDEVDRALNVLTEDYGGFNYDFVYRDAEYVRSSFEGLVQSLIVGACLAFLVLFLFLHDIRSPIVVGISIPVSIFITFALLYFGKVKLNLMSLGGLSLAAGMLVDNAIVVLENINRHLSGILRRDADNEGGGTATSLIDRRREVAEASVRGTGEVARAVLAATFTTIAVFFPVVYVPGIAGAFFRDQALAVVFSLLVSIGTALLLQPMLSARLLSRRQGPARGLFRLFNAGFEAFHRRYHKTLVGVLKRPVLMLTCLVISLVGVGILGLELPRAFMPQRSSGDFRIELELPSGTPVEETAAVVARFAEWIGSDKNVKSVFSQVGRTEKTLESLNEYTAPNTANIRVILKPGRGGRQKGERLQREVAARLDDMPGTLYAFRDEGIGLGEILATDEAAFSMGVMAEDPLVAVQVAQELMSRLADKPEF